jgi:protein-S-isoprenylcysteine O-methyltransferase Ste14
MTILPDLLTGAGLGAAALGGPLLAMLLAANLARPRFGFWPAADGWRRGTGLWLFRLYCAGLMLVAAGAVLGDGLAAWPRLLAGLVVMAGAYALSLASYRQLGRRNTYFAAEGLVTDGLYALSRNPGYLASGVAGLGLSVMAWDAATLALSAGLFGIYTLFALNEERWLLSGYGAAFRDYMARTPRFCDARSLRRSRELIAERL